MRVVVIEADYYHQLRLSLVVTLGPAQKGEGSRTSENKARSMTDGNNTLTLRKNYQLDTHTHLAFPMMRLLSSKAQGHKVFWKPSKPCHVNINCCPPASTLRWVPMCQGFADESGRYRADYYHQLLLSLVVTLGPARKGEGSWTSENNARSMTEGNTLTLRKNYQLHTHIHIALPMLRLLSSKAQGHRAFWKPSKPCHVGLHGIAHKYPYARVSVIFKVFASFCTGQISHQQQNG